VKGGRERGRRGRGGGGGRGVFCRVVSSNGSLGEFCSRSASRGGRGWRLWFCCYYCTWLPSGSSRSLKICRKIRQRHAALVRKNSAFPSIFCCCCCCFCCRVVKTKKDGKQNELELALCCDSSTFGLKADRGTGVFLLLLLLLLSSLSF
jgi:hypothetical protein